jgi:hypothetical protein
VAGALDRDICSAGELRAFKLSDHGLKRLKS